MFKIKYLGAAAVPVLAALAIAAPAGASTSAPPPHGGYTVTAKTRLVNRLDSGGGGNWAVDAITRTASVTNHGPVPASNCGLTTGTCYQYTAQISDTGTFVAIVGAPRPNQNDPAAVNPIIGRHHGKLTGKGTFVSFYANFLPHSGKVPHKVNGNADSTSLWPGQFFPKSTTFAGLSSALTVWDWSYTTISKHPMHWDDNYKTGGQAWPADGDIG